MLTAACRSGVLDLWHGGEMANLIVQAAAAYGMAGLVVAVAFLFWGIGRVDPSAVGAYAFRPLLLPGIVLLWPLVLLRWGMLEARRS